jgi:protein-disulfide isomerase
MTQVSIRLLAGCSVALVTLLGCRANEGGQETTQPLDREDTTRALEGPAVSEPAGPERKPVVAAPGQPDPRAIYRVPLQGDEPQRGPDDALITIVEFGDFECPFCKETEPTLEQLLQKYGDDIRVVWLNFPLPGHTHARPAATAALEAQAQKGDRGFWQMYGRLFADQRALGREDLEKHAKELGLNMRKFRHALDTDKYAEVIDRQVALGTTLGIPGTPSFYMNGQYMAGFPLQTWSYTIDRRLVPLRTMIDSGVPKSELYERIIANGKTAP